MKRYFKILEKIIFALIFFVAIISLSEFFKIGPVTYDDLSQKLFAINKNNNLFDISFSFAKGQGRFFFIYSGLLIFFPYLFDNIIYTKILALFPVILNILLFSYLFFLYFRSKRLLFILIILFFSLLQNSWEHNLLVAYPFVFTTSFNFILIALIFYKKYFNSSKVFWKILSALFFLLSLLTYETFLSYFLFFLIIIFYEIIKLKSNIKTKILFFFKKINYHLFTVFIYIFIYLFFQTKYPAGGYDGNILAKFNLLKYLKTLFQLGISSFPGYVYQSKLYESYFIRYGYTLFGDIRNPLFILQNIQLIWMIKALIVSLSIYLIFEIKEKILNRKSYIFLIIISILLIFIPQLIISLTSKYQALVLSGNIIGFTTTYFSYFGSILFISLIIYRAKEIFRSKILKYIVSFFIIITIFTLSIIVDYTNYHINLSQKQTTLMWQVMEYLLKTSEFNKIPNKSYIYSPNLNTFFTYRDYWNKYISIKTRKDFFFITNIDDLNKFFKEKPQKFKNNLYYLGYYQEEKDPNAFITLAKVDNLNRDLNGIFELYSNKIYLFSYSKYRKYLIIFVTQNNQKSQYQASIDNNIIFANNNKFKYLINKNFHGEPLVKSTIESNNINIESFFISFFTDEKHIWPF